MSSRNQRRSLHTFVVSESIDQEKGVKKQNVIEIEIHYNLGGYNNWNGNDEARGFYLSVKPEMIETREGSPYQSRSYTGFSGIKTCIKELKRFSTKQLENITIERETLSRLLEHVCNRNGLDVAKLSLDEVDPSVFA
ncbi:hypothetical protein [Vibrio agarivorans]|uniref:hypothetical protein n=1 Tax=Vibrio agarivorans TaxID=153622 RepID=UPI0025B44AE9|nr:hypothetical protein [Vibrio agarivorans]MDN3661128.1 hypothetical protein [Vibrio agarivorans]